MLNVEIRVLSLQILFETYQILMMMVMMVVVVGLVVTYNVHSAIDTHIVALHVA